MSLKGLGTKTNWLAANSRTNCVHSEGRAPTGLLYLLPMIMMTENLVEWLAGEIEDPGENLLQCQFVHHESHMI
jgi:hypothetical protein